MRLFETADERIDAHSFPATTDELITEYGDTELALPHGKETFGDALSRLGETTFEDAEEARLMTYSAVSKAAIGRQNYSDRDAPSIGEAGPEPVSF